MHKTKSFKVLHLRFQDIYQKIHKSNSTPIKIIFYPNNIHLFDFYILISTPLFNIVVTIIVTLSQNHSFVTACQSMLYFSLQLCADTSHFIITPYLFLCLFFLVFCCYDLHLSSIFTSKPSKHGASFFPNSTLSPRDPLVFHLPFFSISAILLHLPVSGFASLSLFFFSVSTCI